MQEEPGAHRAGGKFTLLIIHEGWLINITIHRTPLKLFWGVDN